MTNLDKELKKPSTSIFDYPSTCETPDGYPSLLTGGAECWSERAREYEEMTGNRVLPIEYKYDETGSIVKDDEKYEHKPIDFDKVEITDEPKEKPESEVENV